MRRWLTALLVLLWPWPATAQTSLNFDLDGDGQAETIALAGSVLRVRTRGRGEVRMQLDPAARAVETVPLSSRLVLLGVIFEGVGSRCYAFFRYDTGQLAAVPVEVGEDDFADRRICTTAQVQVRWTDLNADGTSELIVEERLSQPKRALRRRVYRHAEGSWNAAPLLSGLSVDGVPILPQMVGSYYRTEAGAALENLQDLQVLRTSPALQVAVPVGGGPYQIALRTPGAEAGVAVTGAQRSVDLARGEQVLTLSVTVGNRTGRLIYDSAADFANPPLVVVGLGRDLDGIYRPAPYDPQWPTLETYLAQGVLVGLWNPLGNVGLVLRDSLRVQAGSSPSGVVLSLRPGTHYSIDLTAAVSAPYDLVLVSPGGPPWLVDLRGADFFALAPARCNGEGRPTCAPAANPVLYRRRDAPS
jgi:hypothetical protein